MRWMRCSRLAAALESCLARSRGRLHFTGGEGVSLVERGATRGACDFLLRLRDSERAWRTAELNSLGPSSLSLSLARARRISCTLLYATGTHTRPLAGPPDRSGLDRRRRSRRSFISLCRDARSFGRNLGPRRLSSDPLRPFCSDCRSPDGLASSVRVLLRHRPRSGPIQLAMLSPERAGDNCHVQSWTRPSTRPIHA